MKQTISKRYDRDFDLGVSDTVANLKPHQFNEVDEYSFVIQPMIKVAGGKL